MSDLPNALGAATLTHVDLGNHNAGEGGSQLSDLKRVGNRPYISGQAYRHAIKDALRARTSEGVDCTPQYACGEISACKLCDLFGYMNTELQPQNDEPKPKRVSPLRVTPLVGQYDAATTTDMILQYAVGGDVKKPDDEDEIDEDQLENRIGYREMTENVFKGAWALDVAAVGQRELEDVTPDADHEGRYTRQLDSEIDEQERIARVEQLLDAILNTTQLAGQARHMADFMPDFIVGASLPVYNQRITNALHVNSDDRTLDVAAFKSVLADLGNQGATVWAAGTHNPEVITNWEEVMDAASSADHVTVEDSVTDCFEAMKTTLTDSE